MMRAVRYSCDVVLSSADDLHVVERDTRPDGYTTLRFMRHTGRDANAGRQKLRHARQLGPASREHEAVAIDRGAPRLRHLGQQALQAGSDRVERLTHRHLHFTTRYAKRGAARLAFAVELDRALVGRGDRRPDSQLEAFGVTRIELGTAGVGDGWLEGAVEGLTANRDRLHGKHFAERDQGYFGRAGTEVDHDDTVGAGDRHLRAPVGGAPPLSRRSAALVGGAS